MNDVIEDIELTSSCTFATTYIFMLDKLHRDRRDYAKQKALLLGTNLVWRNGTLEQSEQLGYIVPFASSIQEFMGMHEVCNFILHL